MADEEVRELISFGWADAQRVIRGHNLRSGPSPRSDVAILEISSGAGAPGGVVPSEVMVNGTPVLLAKDGIEIGPVTDEDYVVVTLRLHATSLVVATVDKNGNPHA